LTQHTPSPQATSSTVEGSARLPKNELGSPVFYNPKMSLNRDLAILFVLSYFPSQKRINICDAMAGTGVRAARYALECSNVEHVVANDNEPEASEVTLRTVELNGLHKKITVSNCDANLLLLNHTIERFDLVDLDPFGSPAPYFESALSATFDGGVVAATATDMGPLSGARAAACRRKYGVSAVRTEFEKEFAVRALAGCLVAIAGRLGLGIEMVFSHASDHYARIYSCVRKGLKFANLSTKSMAYLEYCPNCLWRTFSKSMAALKMVCPNCGRKNEVGGPLWSDSLWDAATVHRMIALTPMLASSRLSDVQKLLELVSSEYEAPALHYRTDVLASTLRIKPPNMANLVSTLTHKGFACVRTHFHPNGFRTNATVREISSVLLPNET
jgi:tRNA (guanine26-N2/guanine27-N2)-dimethyltransferase